MEPETEGRRAANCGCKYNIPLRPSPSRPYPACILTGRRRSQMVSSALDSVSLGATRSGCVALRRGSGLGTVPFHREEPTCSYADCSGSSCPAWSGTFWETPSSLRLWRRQLGDGRRWALRVWKRVQQQSCWAGSALLGDAHGQTSSQMDSTTVYIVELDKTCGIVGRFGRWIERGGRERAEGASSMWRALERSGARVRREGGAKPLVAVWLGGVVWTE